jgi:hypothetical protein
MNLTSINKSVIGDKLRISDPTLVFFNDIYVITTHTVAEDEVCRIDLISLKYYRSENYIDYILKYNGISNPFSITLGDILEIPSNDAVLIKTVPIKAIDAIEDLLNIRDQFISTKRLTVKEAKRVEYLTRKASKKSNGSSQILPPNLLKDGAVNIIISNGKIII